MMTWNNLLKLIIVIVALILFLFGFFSGYLYGDKSCLENPFTYGIKVLNEKNDDEIVCSCRSILGKTNPFSFNENEFKADSLEIN